MKNKQTQFFSLVVLLAMTYMPCSAATLLIEGVGTHESGTGTAADLDMNDVVRYANIGTDGVTSFDALVTVNALSAGITVDATKTGGLLNTSGSPDVWADVTISFVDSSLGTPVNLSGVTGFRFLDIDSQSGGGGPNDFTEVVGLASAPGAVSLGAELENLGFIGATSHPTVGVDYVRANDVSGPNDWTGVPNDDGTNAADYTATWTYASTTESSFRIILGSTGSENTNNRGLKGELDFSSVVAVPEPSNTVLLSLGVVLLAFFRRR